MLPWLRIITWTLTVGLVTAVTVWQLKPAPAAAPTAYQACAAPATCAKALASFKQCRSTGHALEQFGEFNCARVADLYRMCDQRKGASDDATCKAFPYDYLHCGPKACGPVVDAVFAAPTPSPWRT